MLCCAVLCCAAQDMMAATLRSGAFPGAAYKFTGAEGPVKGKRMSNAATRAQLRWEPKYPSFASFMEGGAKDWYNAGAGAGKAPVGMPHA